MLRGSTKAAWKKSAPVSEETPQQTDWASYWARISNEAGYDAQSLAIDSAHPRMLTRTASAPSHVPSSYFTDAEYDGRIRWLTTSSRKGADERPSARKGGVVAEGKPSARKGGAEEKKEAGDSPPAGLSRGKSLKERMAMFEK